MVPPIRFKTIMKLIRTHPFRDTLNLLLLAGIVAAPGQSGAATAPDLKYQVRNPFFQGWQGEGRANRTSKTPRLSLKWLTTSRKRRQFGSVKTMWRKLARTSARETYRVHGSAGRRGYDLTYRTSPSFRGGNFTAEMIRGFDFSLQGNQYRIIAVRIDPKGNRRRKSVVTMKARAKAERRKFDALRSPFKLSSQVR